MLLDRFIINSDFDSQKVQNVVELQLPIALFNLAANATRSFNTTVVIPEGQFFENVFITNPEIVGNYTLMGGNPSYQKNNQYDVYFDAARSDATHYKLTVTFINQTSSQITIPTSTTTCRVHLLVAANN
jgi:hypothetical protein